MPRRRERTLAELTRLQQEADGRRALTFEVFRERVRAVVDATIACDRGEEGAAPALRQAYVDVASVALELADNVDC